MTDRSAESPTTSLAAEAARFSRSAGCNGTDRHSLGWSARTRAIAFVGAITLVWLVMSVSALNGFEALAWGVLLGVAIVAGMSASVFGDELRVNRFGWRRRVRLASVSRVERYEYRSSVSLRLWDAGDDRLPSIPISGLAYRIAPAAAAHLLHQLDQPDVKWGAGAWDTLLEKAGGAKAQPTPRGQLVPRKPPSGWAKAGLYFSGVMSIVLVVFLLVLVPITWRAYLESQRIQHGPYASSTLQRETVTETSGRSGTHHTTHFLVSFTTQEGQLVTTTVDAHGRYRQLVPGSRFAVRYDPRSPRHAELPGRPMDSLMTAVLVTVLAGIAIVTVGGIGTAVLRARRRR